jgi:hypothetical protein
MQAQKTPVIKRMDKTHDRGMIIDMKASMKKQTSD